MVLADLGFRCKDGIPCNLKLSPKGTWNDRMVIETRFLMWTVVGKAKKIHQRLATYLEARLDYLADIFNGLLNLFHLIHPAADPYQLSIAEFSF